MGQEGGDGGYPLCGSDRVLRAGGFLRPPGRSQKVVGPAWGDGGEREGGRGFHGEAEEEKPAWILGGRRLKRRSKNSGSILRALTGKEIGAGRSSGGRAGGAVQ